VCTRLHTPLFLFKFFIFCFSDFIIYFLFFREALISGVGEKIAADFPPKKGLTPPLFVYFMQSQPLEKKGHKKKNARG
jgi:hypothetical protein